MYLGGKRGTPNKRHASLLLRKSDWTVFAATGKKMLLSPSPFFLNVLPLFKCCHGLFFGYHRFFFSVRISYWKRHVCFAAFTPLRVKDGVENTRCTLCSKTSKLLLQMFVSAVFLSFSSFLVTPAVSFQKKPISYSLLINPSSLFSISAETGEISLTRPIDYEVDQHRYLLLVRASEGQDSMSSAAEVCV